MDIAGAGAGAGDENEKFRLRNTEKQSTHFSLVTMTLQFVQLFISVSDPDPDGSGFFLPILIRFFKVQIRICPFVNLYDLNDGFDKDLEEPDQKGQLRVLDMKQV